MKKSILLLTVALMCIVSNRAMAKDTNSPGAINDLSATSGINEGEIDLQFTAPGDDNYSADDTLNGKYYIQYSTNSSSAWDYNSAQAEKIIKDVNYGETNKLIVAMIGDPQFGFPSGIDPEPSLSNAVFTMTDLSNVTHDFFIAAGDLIQPNVIFWPYFHDTIVGMASRPQYLIAGNAEFYMTLENYVNETGFPIGGYTVEKRGIRFIFLNTTEVSGKTTHIVMLAMRKWRGSKMS